MENGARIPPTAQQEIDASKDGPDSLSETDPRGQNGHPEKDRSAKPGEDQSQGHSDVMPKGSGDGSTTQGADGAEPDKVAHEIEKLKLERKILERQLSRSGLAMEWLKAATVPAALLGAAITLYIGFGQIKQSEENRDADRFDKALSRLASEKQQDRLTGVAGLRLFVSDPHSSLRRQALEYLVNSLAVDSSEQVQSAILDVFTDLKSGQIDQGTLNSVLQSALEEDRRLSGSIVRDYRKRILSFQAKILEEHLRTTKRLNAMPVIEPPFPTDLIGQLSDSEYLDFHAPPFDRFEHLEPELRVPLAGISHVIPILVKLGTTISDFTEIYCQGCDFSGGMNLNEAKVDRSFLADANFSHAHLEGAHFTDAQLDGAIFFSAHLYGAHLDFHMGKGSILSRRKGISYPLLECADLRGADLTGITLLSVFRNFGQLPFPRTVVRVPSLVLSR